MANIMDMMASLPRDNTAKACRRSRRRMEDTGRNLMRKKTLAANLLSIYSSTFFYHIFTEKLSMGRIYQKHPIEALVGEDDEKVEREKTVRLMMLEAAAQETNRRMLRKGKS
jgi:hypothetical protein